MRRYGTTHRQSLVTTCLAAVLFAFVVSTSSAQSKSRRVQNLSQVQESLKNKPTDLSRFNSLLSDENQSIYILENSEKVYGSSPIVIYTDLANVSRLALSKFPTDKIEFIRIKLSNINNSNDPISIEIFKRFKSLKYVEFLLESEIQDSEAQKLVDSVSSEFIVFYQIIKGS